MGWVDPGSTGGAVGNDGDLANNLTDPCWLLDRAAQLLHADRHPTRAALAPLGRTMAETLSALRYHANACGEPLAEVVSLTITQLRLWAGTVDAEETPLPRRVPGEQLNQRIEGLGGPRRPA